MAVNWGVIGAGGIAWRRTIPEGIMQAANARLVAVMDVRPEAVRMAADRFAVQRVYTSEEDLIADPEVGAVYIATPTHLHHRQTLLAARAGKHVLCEKPMAMSEGEATEMIEVCARHNVRLGLGFMMRFHAHHQRVKAMIHDGLLGQLVMGRAQLTCWYPAIPGAWRQDPSLGGGGPLADMGSHCIDVLEMFFGRVRRVSAFTARLAHPYAVEDTATMLLEFASGAHGICDNYFNVPDAAVKNVLEVYGTLGSVRAEGTIGQSSTGSMTVYRQDEALDYEALQSRAPRGCEETLQVEPVNIYRAQVEHFTRGIEEGQDPAVSGEDGLHNLRVVLAAYESARSGKAVAVA